MSLPLHTALAQCNLHAKRLAQAAADSGLPLAVAPREGEDDALIRQLAALNRVQKLGGQLIEWLARFASEAGVAGPARNAS